jgi:lauroyl/myristoyl acyltransferase
MAIARHLKRGGVVATVLDFYVESTRSIPINFFGKPAATPADIFQLSIATGAPIVPVCVVTDARSKKSV